MRPLGLFVVLVFAASCAKSSKERVTVERPSLGGRLNCTPSGFHAAADDIPRLQPSENCPKYVGYLIAALTQSRGYFRFSDTADSATSELTFGDTSGSGLTSVLSTGSGPAGYSKTNVQEAGIDEADFVKTDGKHIYLLHGNALKVLKSWPPTELSVLSTLTLEGAPQAMLLFEKRIAVVSQVGMSTGVGSGEGLPEFLPSTRISIVNVGKPAAPTIERTIDMEITYLDARLVDGRALIAGRAAMASPDIVVPDEARDDPATLRSVIAQAVTQTTFDDWLPTMLDSATGERELLLNDFDSLYVPTVTGTVGATAVVSFDLAHGGAALNKVVLAAEGGELYANADALYVTFSNRWWWWGGWGPGGDAISYVHRLRLNAEAIPHYTGSVTVPGWLANPFWMSEYDKHLRVVTAAGGVNRLRTFSVAGNGDPELLAEIKGFAPQETVTGVRFMGPRAYVSTAIIRVNFIKDPFFTFDLGDPAAPKLKGALEMPGYTTYIHPLSDDYVLAVGMFAEAMGEPVTAVQVQVFDVRDFANPITASQHVFTVGDTGISFSEALDNHLAFTFYEPQGIFALPLADFSGSWSTAFNGLAALRVGADASLTELGRIDHFSLAPSSDWWGSNVRRSIVMEGTDEKVYLYSISANGLIANDIADFSTAVGRVKLPAPVWDY